MVPAGAASVEYWVAPNATTYHASIELNGVAEYSWWEIGLLGERIPLSPENITLIHLESGCDPCPFTRSSPNTITFEQGNYSLGYDSRIKDNHLLAEFEEPYTVLVHIPSGLDVRNPLLGSISPGGQILETENDTVLLRWNETRAFECRFYDPFRETILTTFFTVWGVIALILLFPYLLFRRKGER